MTSADPSFDFSYHLGPIGDSGVGTNPRKSGASGAKYMELKLSYDKLLEEEKSILLSDDPKLIFSAEWGSIIDQGTEFLAHKAKDLEVACWVVAGMTRMSKFKGLYKGLKLIQALIATYPEDIYPLPKRENHRFRYIPLLRLCGETGEGQLHMALKSIPIFAWAPDAHAMGYEKYSAPQKTTDHAKLCETFEAVKDKMRTVSVSEAAVPFRELSEARMVLAEIYGTINSHFEPGDHQSENLSGLLRQIQVMYINLSSERFVETNGMLVDPSTTSVEESGTGDGSGSMVDGPQISGATTAKGASQNRAGPIDSRAEAIRRLHQVKDYFRTHEPHSPISYGIERVCRWSSLTLPELIAELIQNESAKEDYQNLTGIPDIEINEE